MEMRRGDSLYETCIFIIFGTHNHENLEAKIKKLKLLSNKCALNVVKKKYENINNNTKC